MTLSLLPSSFLQDVITNMKKREYKRKGYYFYISYISPSVSCDTYVFTLFFYHLTSFEHSRFLSAICPTEFFSFSFSKPDQGSVVLSHGNDVLSVPCHLTARRLKAGGQNAHQSGLAGAVRSEKPLDSGFKRIGERIQRPLLSVVFRQIFRR